MSNKEVVSVVSGSLDESKTDAIALSVTTDLNMTYGATSNAVFEKSGCRIENEARQKLPGRYLDYGKTVEVKATGRLSCRVVILCALEPMHGKVIEQKTKETLCRKNVDELMVACFATAEKSGCSSIAFPAIGTGASGYPADVVADQMFKTIANYHFNKSVKKVDFVIFYKDGRILSMFNKSKAEWKSRVSRLGLPTAHSGKTGFSQKTTLQTNSRLTALRIKSASKSLSDSAYGSTEGSTLVKETNRSKFGDSKPSFTMDPSKGARPKERHQQIPGNTPVGHLREFKISNVLVKVYCSNLLQTDVDAIVNAANGQLKHEGGLARQVADAAGQQLQQECKAVLRQRTSLKVGEVCHTTAGNLKFRYIIHAVGPIWNDKTPTNENTKRCEKGIQDAVKNSLTEAEHLCVPRIALPTISSGLFGVPMKICCANYAIAVEAYVSLAENPLSEIHFVDVDEDMVKVMHRYFEKVIDRGQRQDLYASTYKTQQNQTDSSSQRAARSQETACWFYTDPPGRNKKELTVRFSSGQRLYIYTENILSLKNIDVIVCNDVQSGTAVGGLADALSKFLGRRYQQEKKKTFGQGQSPGSVVVCKGSSSSFKWIFHAVLFQKKNTEGKIDRETKIRMVYNKIMGEAISRTGMSVALPSLGSGKGGADPAYYTECLLREFDSYFKNKDSFFEMHLVNKRKANTDAARDVAKRFFPESNKPVYKPKPPESNARSMHTADSNTFQFHSLNGWENNGLGDNTNLHDVLKGKNTGEETGGTEPCALNRRSIVSTKSIRSSSEQKNQNLKTHRVGGNGSSECINNVYVAQKDLFTGNSEDDLDKSRDLVDLKCGKASADEFKNTKSSDTDGCSSTDSNSKGGNLLILDGDEDENGSLDVTNDDANVDIPEPDDTPSEIATDDIDDQCAICIDTISEPQKLSCGHVFCKTCIEAQFVYKEACPTCGTVMGIITGDQPKGDIRMTVNGRAHCVGYEQFGRIEITYTFKDGRQGPDHPNPGSPFQGITRTAYLPNNKKGKEVSKMLQVAFHRRLVFTIGSSRTTGKEGVITWNDIHHKTDPKPNSQFGYPDPTYLDRVADELKAKGVTPDDVKNM